MCGELYYRRKAFHGMGGEYRDRHGASPSFSDDRVLLAFLMKQERIHEQRLSHLTPADMNSVVRQITIAVR